MAPRKIAKKLFGTNGVRGVIGKDMTPELVLSIGEAFGTMRKGQIAIGRDTGHQVTLFFMQQKRDFSQPDVMLLIVVSFPHRPSSISCGSNLTAES